MLPGGVPEGTWCLAPLTMKSLANGSIHGLSVLYDSESGLDVKRENFQPALRLLRSRPEVVAATAHPADAKNRMGNKMTMITVSLGLGRSIEARM